MTDLDVLEQIRDLLAKARDLTDSITLMADEEAIEDGTSPIGNLWAAIDEAHEQSVTMINDAIDNRE